MIIKGATVFVDNSFKKTDLEIIDGKFTKVEENIDGDYEIVLTDKIIIPGLVDLHTHGAIGYDFGDCNTEQAKLLANFYLNNGTTSLLPTIVTLSENNYEAQIKNIVSCYSEDSPFVGINLEGPFISFEKKGAHNERNIIPIDCEFAKKLWEFSNHSIKLMTVAPELKGVCELQNFAADKFEISAGHSSCDYDDAKKAFSVGINHVTHLFNAMNSLHHRKPSLIGCALEYPVIKELVCDGTHVDTAILRALFRGYSDEIAIISDSVSACGLGDGNYSIGGLDVIVKDNMATLINGTIAGSINTLYDNIKYLIEIGVDKDKAIKSATYIPAKSIGMEKEIGSIKKDLNADFLICDNNFNLLEVWKKGQKLNKICDKQKIKIGHKCLEQH